MLRASLGHTGWVDQQMAAQWAQLPAAWRDAFGLAWEAFRVGSPPVGAVVVDSSGAIVGRGRSRRAERSAPPGQLAGGRLSHAEVNALALLGADESPGCELLVTLEPCFLCVAAAATARVRTVRFAGADPMWRFLGALPDLHPVLEERWFTAEGPMPGPWGAWASLLPVIERLERRPLGARIEAFAETAPDLLALAREIVDGGRAARLRERELLDATDTLWSDLCGLAPDRR
jgi:tRNA(adenine34) deaminase